MDGPGQTSVEIEICKHRNNFTASLSSCVAHGHEQTCFCASVVSMSVASSSFWLKHVLARKKTAEWNYIYAICWREHATIVYKACFLWDKLTAMKDRERLRLPLMFWPSILGQHTQRNITDFINWILLQKALRPKSKFRGLADECTTKCSWFSYFCKNNVYAIKVYIKAPSYTLPLWHLAAWCQLNVQSGGC